MLDYLWKCAFYETRLEWKLKQLKGTMQRAWDKVNKQIGWEKRKWKWANEKVKLKKEGEKELRLEEDNKSWTERNIGTERNIEMEGNKKGKRGMWRSGEYVDGKGEVR